MKTVKELIAILQSLPPDMRVLVTGYESGYDDPGPVTTMRLRQWDGHLEGSVLGQYEELDHEDDDGPGAFNAVVIPR